MTTDTTLTQFKLAILASIMAKGGQTASASVKAAKSIWDAAGEELNPLSKAKVAMSLTDLLPRIMPKIAIKARKPRYRKFLTWLEWQRWGPDFLHFESPSKGGGQVGVEVKPRFIKARVDEELRCQVKEGVPDSCKIIMEYESFCVSEKLDRIWRAKNAANARYSNNGDSTEVHPNRVVISKAKPTRGSRGVARPNKKASTRK